MAEILYTTDGGLPKPTRYADEKETVYADALDLVNRLVVGYLEIANGDANYTLKDTGADRESRTLALKFTSTLTAARQIKIDTTTAGKYRGRFFIMWNAGAGNFKLTVLTTAGGSTGVDISNGLARLVWHDGTNVYAIGPEINPTTGLVTSPSARVYHSTTQSLANNTYAALAFDSERFDTDTIHDTSTNNSRLTCKTAGLYLITGHVGFAAHATGYRIAALRVGGSTYIANQGGLSIGVVDPTVLTVSTIYPLAVSDYVDLIAYQNSGGALNAVSLANQAPEFMMVRLSA